MTSSDIHTWHILGAGAIGSLWANYLLRNKQKVSILCRSPEQLDAFWDNPFLTLIVDGQRYKSQPDTELYSSNQPIDKLLVTTKSYDTLSAMDSIAHRITRDTKIVVFQNGMGNQQSVAERFPNSAVYAGITTEGAYRTGPHQVVHAGKGKTWFGPFNKAAGDHGAAPLKALLELELPSRHEDSIHTRLWQKLAINCAINGLTAIHDCRNGELINPPYYDEMEILCQEVESVAAALNQPLFERPLIEEAKDVAIATAENLSSMLQDVRHQRRTEIDCINGFLCRQAEQLGVPVPNNLKLTEQINELSGNKEQQ